MSLPCGALVSNRKKLELAKEAKDADKVRDSLGFCVVARISLRCVTVCFLVLVVEHRASQSAGFCWLICEHFCEHLVVSCVRFALHICALKPVASIHSFVLLAGGQADTAGRKRGEEANRSGRGAE